MAERKTDRHGWLRAALADRGHMAKDVATAWGCDDAVISRFIKTGEPQLTMERAKALTFMLDMSLDELQARLDGHGSAAPRRTATRAAAPPRHEPPQAPPGSELEKRMMALREAAEAVREVIGPGMQVDVTFSCRGSGL